MSSSVSLRQPIGVPAPELEIGASGHLAPAGDRTVAGAAPEDRCDRVLGRRSLDLVAEHDRRGGWRLLEPTERRGRWYGGRVRCTLRTGDRLGLRRACPRSRFDGRRPVGSGSSTGTPPFRRR